VILGAVNDTGALAAVDCGTNSTRLLVVGPAGDVRAREMRITRLGEGVDATRRLRPEAVERTLAVLREYRSIMDAEQVGRTRLVATSAVRDATNGEDFLLPAADIIGAPAELLSGADEGRLSFAGATADLPEQAGGTVVVDIGGGSTELVTMEHGEILAVSLDIGCVRLTERFLRSDPPTGPEVAAAVDVIGTELSRAVQMIPILDDSAPPRLVGVAGTVSTLASLVLDLKDYDRERIHHAVLTIDAVCRWCEILGSERVAERAERPAITEGRQDVIFAGALVLREVMHRLEQDECIVSESDILDGLVMSLLPHREKRFGEGDGDPVS
jgi:exopolyphosphatase/guanosine-5'-triphosphate,3'-diphosphate pyrophosphatase